MTISRPTISGAHPRHPARRALSARDPSRPADQASGEEGAEDAEQKCGDEHDGERDRVQSDPIQPGETRRRKRQQRPEQPEADPQPEHTPQRTHDQSLGRPTPHPVAEGRAERFTDAVVVP